MTDLKNDSIPSSAIFPQLSSALSDPTFKKKALGTKTLFAFTLKTSTGATDSWYLDFKKDGVIGKGVAPAGVEKPDVEMIMSDEDFGKLVEGKANAQRLFMGGKLKVKGDVMRATKMEMVLKGAREVLQPKAKL